MMQTSTTVVTSLKRVSADADAMMEALERRIQANAHALAVQREEKKKRGVLPSVGSFTKGGVLLINNGGQPGQPEKENFHRMMTSRDWTKDTKDDDVNDDFDTTTTKNEKAAAAAKTTTTRGDAKRADAHFRKGLEMLRRNAPKEALGEFEMALERCPVHAKRARKTLENARERAMEMVYSGGTCAEDDDDDDDEDVLTTSREAGKANEEEKKDVDVDDDFAPSSSSTSGTKRERKTPTKANREAIEELYDASRWLLRSTPRDGREAVRLLKMAERMLRDDDDENGEFLDDRERKEIRIAKEKIERAIKLVKR